MWRLGTFSSALPCCADRTHPIVELKNAMEYRLHDSIPHPLLSRDSAPKHSTSAGEERVKKAASTTAILLFVLAITTVNAYAQCDNQDHCTTYPDLAVTYPPFGNPFCSGALGNGCTECYNCDAGGAYKPGSCVTETKCDPFQPVFPDWPDQIGWLCPNNIWC